MSTLADIRGELLAMRAQCDRAIEKIDTIAVEPAAPTTVFMTPRQYAERRQVSEATMRRWLKLGLPHKRRGRIVRVVVAEADLWSDKSAVARAATIEASRGET